MPMAPVLAPEERSNSPPIMSTDTATAMMPRVDAVSSQFWVWPAVPKLSDTAQKNVQTPITPMMAPISGWMNSR